MVIQRCLCWCARRSANLIAHLPFGAKMFGPPFGVVSELLIQNLMQRGSKKPPQIVSCARTRVQLSNRGMQQPADRRDKCVSLSTVLYIYRYDFSEPILTAFQMNNVCISSPHPYSHSILHSSFSHPNNVSHKQPHVLIAEMVAILLETSNVYAEYGTTGKKSPKIQWRIGMRDSKKNFRWPQKWAERAVGNRRGPYPFKMAEEGRTPVLGVIAALDETRTMGAKMDP
ncbi:hypothetical protein EDD21DRAFT_361397 [Dissophora ornata]|nr:hypothetical protein EDD21DRAFT_361397 [Dissophora ornata]